MFKGLTFHLAEEKEEVKGKSIGVPTGEEFKRASLFDLESMYFTDPPTFNGINIYTQVMLSCKPEVVCSNEKEQRYMDSVLKKIKFYKRALPKIPLNCCIYGGAWNEMVLGDEVNSPVLNFPTRDPKYYDFLRSNYGRIVFNEHDEPLGYIQFLEYDIPEQPNEIRVMGQRAIQLPTDVLTHTTFLTVGDSFNGIGLIEPVYNAIRLKNNALKEMVNRLKSPVIGIKVGTEAFPVDDITRLDAAAENFRDIDEQSVISYPYYNAPELIEPKGKVNFRENVDVFNHEVVAGLGLAEALITGRGENTNRSVLDDLLSLFYMRLDWFQEAISASLEEQLFTYMYHQKRFEEVPKLVWRDTSIDSLNAKSERLDRWLSNKVLRPTEDMEDLVREWENLPKRKKVEPQED